MELETRHIGKALIVSVLERRLDLRIAADFKKRMRELINEGNHFVVLNLSKVEFMDSSAIGAIVSSLKGIGQDGDLVLCNVQSRVMPLLKLTRMDEILRLFKTEEDAVADF